MRLGYYFVDGDRYGDHFHEVNGTVTTLHRVGMWECTRPGEPVGNVAGLVASLERARVYGKMLSLALEIDFEQSPPWQRVLDQIPEELLQAVNYFEVADEPDWSRADARAAAGEVRSELVDHGVHDPVLGVTLDERRIMSGMADYYGPAQGYGQISVEVYGPWRDDVVGYVEMLFSELPEVERWVVAQAFRFGGMPKPEVVDLQWPIADAAHELDARSILWFAYGRTDGVVGNRRLIERHKEIYQKYGEGL